MRIGHEILVFVFDTRVFYTIFLVSSILWTFLSCLQSWFTLTVTNQVLETSTSYSWFYGSIKKSTFTPSQLNPTKTIPNESPDVVISLLSSFSLTVISCSICCIAGVLGCLWIVLRLYDNNFHKLQKVLRLLWPFFHCVSILLAISSIVQIIFSLPVAFKKDQAQLPFNPCPQHTPSICTSFTNSYQTLEIEEVWGPATGWYLGIAGCLFQIAAVVLLIAIIHNDRTVTRRRNRVGTGYVSLLEDDKGFLTNDESGGDSRRSLHSSSGLFDFTT